jgi:hypothetical protein
VHGQLELGANVTFASGEGPPNWVQIGHFDDQAGEDMRTKSRCAREWDAGKKRLLEDIFRRLPIHTLDLQDNVAQLDFVKWSEDSWILNTYARRVATPCYYVIGVAECKSTAVIKVEYLPFLYRFLTLL